MLSFFRKYQRYFFMGITVVIVISFSFFGTYKTLQAPTLKNEIAFKSVDGSDISQSELDEMRLFLEADEQTGDRRTARFLNDAVFRKELIASGIGNIVADAFPLEIETDLQERLVKEKAYKPYVHPQASFISTLNAWSNFSPALKDAFESLQSHQTSSTPQFFAARAQLYLAEKQLPPTFLRQIFKYQEKQFSWLVPDENIDHTDFSLFGYHTAEDWFGPSFMTLAAQFVINSAKVAEQRGYRVSQAEAAADLHLNADLAFEKILKQNRYMASVTSSDEFLSEQLRTMGLNEERAVRIWRNVLLFRKLFDDAGRAVFVDLLPFNTFASYTRQSAKGTLYQLPEGLQLSSFKDLQKFQFYLAAISKRYQPDSLALPQEFAIPSEVVKKYPELVEKRYLVEMSMLDRTNLYTKVSLKETWNWETDSANWGTLTKEFPELGTKKSETRQDKFVALDALNATRRNAVDAFARKAIVALHPEWITEGLKEEVPQVLVVGITYKGEGSPIRGLTDGAALIALLDKAPLPNQADDQTSQIAEELSQFTANDTHYYALKVLERLQEPEILTFAEANRRGTLDALRTAELEKYYLDVRKETPADFQKEDQSWKSFADVQDNLAERYFQPIMAALQRQFSAANAYSKRLLPYVTAALNAVNKGQYGPYVQSVETPSSVDQLVPASLPAEQWKLVKKPFELARKQSKEGMDSEAVLAMADGEWSSVQSAPNGALSFFQKQAAVAGDNSAIVLEGVNKARALFFSEVQQALAKDLIVQFKEKKAMSLPTKNAAEINSEIPSME